MTIAPVKVHANAVRALGTYCGVGNCLKNVREWNELVAVYALDDAYAAHVADAAKATGQLYPFDPATTPKGASVVLYGGSTLVNGKPAGHIMTYDGPGTGTFISAGVPTDTSHVRRCTLQAILTGWPGHTVAGWVSLLEGETIPQLVAARNHLLKQAAKAEKVKETQEGGGKDAKAKEAPPTLRVVQHNVHVANTAANVIEMLNDQANSTDVFALCECYHLHTALKGWADDHGWTLIHKPYGKPKHPGATPEHADAALLIHPNHKVKVRRRIVLTKTWRGPKGELHDGREIPTALVRVRGTWWRIACGHGPLGALEEPAASHPKPAWLEFIGRAGHWLIGGVHAVLGRAAVWFADFNAGNETLDAHLPAEVTVHVERIDGALLHNAKVTKVEELPPYGSDHPHAQLFHIEATKKKTIRKAA